MENWRNVIKIILPIAAIIILLGAYFYFRNEEQNQDSSQTGSGSPAQGMEDLDRIKKENELKATADESYVPDPESVSNASITPPNSETLDIEPDPGVINSLSAPSAE